MVARDLTGFDGRCDAIYFTRDGKAPPNSNDILPPWRRKLLGLSDQPAVKDGYDLVVIGGGYSGLGAAISAARMGCKVALIQDRPVLGGNGSSEVRVWAMGDIKRGKYPRIGEIVEEFCDHAKKSPGPAEQFGDEKKEAVVRAESNIDLFLNQRVFKVDQQAASPAHDGSAGGRIISRGTALRHCVRTKTRKFVGRLFEDCTGHAEIGRALRGGRGVGARAAGWA